MSVAPRRARVKICGLTRPEDAEAAVSLGADLLGLNFWPGSPRCADAVSAREIVAAVAGRAVLVVDDIQDTGRTLAVAERLVADAGAASIKSCALLDKPERRVVEFDADFVGFTIPDVFVVGYGIDYAERYRHLPYIGHID